MVQSQVLKQDCWLLGLFLGFLDSPPLLSRLHLAGARRAAIRVCLLGCLRVVRVVGANAGVGRLGWLAGLEEVCRGSFILKKVPVDVGGDLPDGEFGGVAFGLLLVLAGAAADGCLMESHLALEPVASQLRLELGKLEMCLELELFAGDVHEGADLVDARLDLLDVTDALARLELFRFEDRRYQILWLHFCS